MRVPGGPYTEIPMASFDVTDLQNAVALGLLEKAKVTGSFEWERYVVRRSRVAGLLYQLYRIAPGGRLQRRVAVGLSGVA